jgi:parvulin-like peptidyl-prolyl isomerase
LIGRRLAILTLCAVCLLAVACQNRGAPGDENGGAAVATTAVEAGPVVTQPSLVAPEVAPSATPIPPSPTPTEPLAATVNDEPIYLSLFEETLARQQQGQSAVAPEGGATENQETVVLDMLIERVLIEQAAAANGIVVTPEMVDAQMAELRRVAEEAGGEGAFAAWLQANQWTEATFREALSFEMLTERVSAMVTADVPEAVPQVHARYLQVEDEALAQSLLEQIRNGADFAALAQEHSLDRATAADGGDLGYFARGTLLVPALEEAAFALQPGEVSDVITATTPDGGQTVYYLVQVVDIDPERPLAPDLRAALLQERFSSWLVEEWAQADIVRYIDA